VCQGAFLSTFFFSLCGRHAPTLAQREKRAAAWHRELFDLVQSRREFLLLVPLKLTLAMMRGNNGIVNKMEF
jgi:hypothetical protein